MTKRLDKQAYDIMIKAHESGVKYAEMLKNMNKMGYTTARGNPIHDRATLSQFMIARGHRTYAKRRAKWGSKKHVRRMKEATTHAPSEARPNKQTEDFMLDVLVNKHLTKEQKVKILQTLI